MFNFANSTDVYKIWADMVAYDHSTISNEGREHFYCCYCGRRDGKNFVMDHAAIMAKYGDRIKMVQRIPKALAGADGRYDVPRQYAHRSGKGRVLPRSPRNEIKL